MTLRVHPDEIVAKSSSGLLATHSSWGRVRLEQIASVLNGCAFPSTGFGKSGDMPLIRIRDVGREATDTWYTGVFEPKYVIESGSLIVGMDGEFRVDIWRGPPSLLNQRVCKIEVRNHALYSERFLRWVLPGYLEAVNHETSSVTVKHLSSQTIKELPLPLPPIAEQERIVVAIEEQFSRLDASVAALGRIRRNITRMRGAVLRAAVTGMLSVGDAASVEDGRVDDDPLADHLNATNARKVQRAADDLSPLTWVIPPSWAWKSASDVCEVVASGSTPAKAAMTAGCGDVPFIKVYNLTHSGDLDFSVRPTFIDRATHEGSLRRSRLYPGDVLTNIVGPPLGKVSVVPNEYPEWNTNQAVVVFRPVPSIHPRLLRYWLLSPPVLKLLESTSRATAGQFNVSLTTCRALPLPIPPRAEQGALVAIIEDCFSLLDAVEVAADHALSRSSSLRASILAAAFSGELVSQDPSDEPASALLERIAAERASSSGHKSVKAHSRRRSKATA